MKISEQSTVSREWQLKVKTWLASHPDESLESLRKSFDTLVAPLVKSDYEDRNQFIDYMWEKVAELRKQSVEQVWKSKVDQWFEQHLDDSITDLRQNFAQFVAPLEAMGQTKLINELWQSIVPRKGQHDIDAAMEGKKVDGIDYNNPMAPLTHEELGNAPADDAPAKKVEPKVDAGLVRFLETITQFNAISDCVTIKPLRPNVFRVNVSSGGHLVSTQHYELIAPKNMDWSNLTNYNLVVSTADPEHTLVFNDDFEPSGDWLGNTTPPEWKRIVVAPKRQIVKLRRPSRKSA